MIDFKETIINLNEILKKNDISLVNEFTTEYKKLIVNFSNVQFFININENLIKHAYKLIIMLYGEKATLSHFSILLNNYNNKGEKMIKNFSELIINNPDIEKEASETYGWLISNYYSGLKGEIGSTKTYEHCYISRFISDFILHKALSYNI